MGVFEIVPHSLNEMWGVTKEVNFSGQSTKVDTEEWNFIILILVQLVK